MPAGVVCLVVQSASMHEILERIGCGTRCGWVSEWVVSDAPGRRQHASRYEMAEIYRKALISTSIDTDTYGVVILVVRVPVIQASRMKA